MRSLLILGSLSLIAACGSHKEKEEPVVTTDTVVNNTVTKDTADDPASKLPQPASLLSKVVNGLLDARYEGKWVVVNDSVAQWPKEYFDYFVVNGRKKDKEYPYIVKGDFNGDGENDVAALVKEIKGNDFQLAIVLRKVNKTEKSEYFFWNEDIDMAALELYPNGEIMNLDTKPVKMRGDGITVEYYEKASFVVYWDGKGFKRVYTSD